MSLLLLPNGRNSMCAISYSLNRCTGMHTQRKIFEKGKFSIFPAGSLFLLTLLLKVLSSS